MRRWRIIIAVLVMLGGAGAWLARSPRASGEMGRDVYVWQRSWGEGVKSSVVEHGREFDTVVALAGQVSWKEGRPQVARVGVDWEALKQSGARAGVALRINEYRGAFGEATEFLCDLAEDVVKQARGAGVEVAELQIDFDAAESKLDGYRVWVEAIGQRVGPVKVVITALPSWLDASGFGDLARASGGYILQVHSFERPVLGEKMTLCDAERARDAVERAGRIGVPFRVALPTYAHAVAFDAQGRLLGISAEGRRDYWASGAIVREVHADAGEMAGLVREWRKSRPAMMKGVIWYRLPVAEDGMNWRWPTLAAVMAGRSPMSSLKVEQARDEKGIVTLTLVNCGEADEPAAVRVAAQGRFAAFDGFGAFIASGAGDCVTFASSNKDRRIGAGDRMVIGWVRTEEKDVVAHVER